MRVSPWQALYIIPVGSPYRPEIDHQVNCRDRSWIPVTNWVLCLENGSGLYNGQYFGRREVLPVSMVWLMC